MIYVASPYSSPDLSLMELRYEAARAYTFLHIAKGLAIYSPITMCHHMTGLKDEATGDFGFWMAHDLNMVSWSTAVHVLKLTGWKASVGVKAEIAHAEKLGIPVLYVDWMVIHG